MKAFWNSCTRTNVEVEIIGENGNMYAIKADGHVYVVPKVNITPEKKVITTIAPKPEEPYWVALTTLDRAHFIQHIQYFVEDLCWGPVIREIVAQGHSGEYTYEWFLLSARAVRAILTRYEYDKHKPASGSFKTVVQQVWEERLRRDGILPK